MAIKEYILEYGPSNQRINKSIDLSFFTNIPWIKSVTQPEEQVVSSLPWKIDNKKPKLEGKNAIRYEYKGDAGAILYGIWELSGVFELQNLLAADELEGKFVGVVALSGDHKSIVEGPVFTKNISLENIKIIKDYAKTVFGTNINTYLGLSGETKSTGSTKSAGITTIPLVSSKPYKNLCDIILAETIKSYLL